MEQFDVFISYRRENASESARIFQQFLEGKGLRVFLDVDSLGSGHFDKQILQHIDQCRHFLFIASPGSLDRCVNEDDWVRLEIAHALKTKKNVVPVVMAKFEWPKPIDLPEEIRELQRNNAFTYSHEYWRETQDKLAARLLGQVVQPNYPMNVDSAKVKLGKSQGTRILIASAFLILIAVAAGVLWQRQTNSNIFQATPTVEAIAPEVISVPIPVVPDPVPVVIEAPPPPPIKGNWNFKTQATTSNYKLYEGLVSVYRIDLYYIGPKQVEGNGELWSEGKPSVVGREADVVGKNHAPIAIRGSVDDNSLHLSFEVKSPSRTFTGSADFTWDDATTSWIGKYYSGAGASSGTASLTQR